MKKTVLYIALSILICQAYGTSAQRIILNKDVKTPIQPKGPSYRLGPDSLKGGFIFYVSAHGYTGLVAATQDQTDKTISWDKAEDFCKNPDNHNKHGKRFQDWRLPTVEELQWMYDIKDEIGAFIPFFYWTSIESTQAKVWSTDFEDGSKVQFDRNSYNRVRCVRSF